MGFTVVYFAGHVLRHIGGLLLLCWRRMIWAALIAGGAGLLLAEIGGSSVTHQVPAPIPAQIAAALFAIGLGYGAALTILFVEMVAGAVETIRLLEGEAEAGARVAAVIGERADGELSGVVGWIDAGVGALIARLTRRAGSPQRAASAQPGDKQTLSPASMRAAKSNTPRPRPQAPAPLAQRPPLELQRAAPTRGNRSQAAEPPTQSEVVTLNLETLAEIAATEEFVNTAPRPKVNARPVPADQLPRIEWTYETTGHHQADGVAPASASAPLVAPLERQLPSATSEEQQPPRIPPLPIAPANALAAASETLHPSSPPARPLAISPVTSENPSESSSAHIEQRQAGRVTPPLQAEDSGAY